MANKSYWRQKASATIARVVREAQAQHLGISHDELIKLVDDAYPFGPRELWPYKAWLIERRLWLKGGDGDGDGEAPALPRKEPSANDYMDTPLFNRSG